MKIFSILSKRRWWVVGLLLLLYPWVASPFFVFQIGAQTLILGTIALSLSFLVGSGGIVSLSQMTVAGVAGYAVAILGVAGATAASLNFALSWWIAVPSAIIIATLVAIGIGILAGLTEGIYTIMITLAIGVAFYYLTQQDILFFNGFQGIAGIAPPMLWGFDLRAPILFFYLCLIVAALALSIVTYLLRTPFGITFQGTRDNQRRMEALGFSVKLHRLASHIVAGLIASTAGILWVWYQGRISPGTIGLASLLNILIIAVLGGLNKPIGVYLGAFVFVFLQNFAIDLVSPERFNLFIGSVFLLIVFFSPDGIIGIWQNKKWYKFQKNIFKLFNKN